MATALPPFQAFLESERDTVWRFLVSLVGAEEAEDCFQETFIAALGAYPRLRAGSNPTAWVLAIARNKAIDAHRSRARRPIAASEPAALEARRTQGAGSAAGLGEDPAAGLGEGPAANLGAGTAAGLGARSVADPVADDALAGDTAATLWEAVRELPERQRSAVALRFIADLPHREIAHAIGCSEEAARRSLHEGLKRLREQLEPQEARR